MSNVEETLQERGKRYGEFADHAAYSQRLKQIMRESPNWEQFTHSQREALDMIQHKIARMLNGDPTYIDNVTDIVGYGTLMLNDMVSGCDKE